MKLSANRSLHAPGKQAQAVRTSVAALPTELKGARGRALVGRSTRLEVKAMPNSGLKPLQEIKEVIVAPEVWGDEEMREESRKYRRTVFDFAKWRAHRAPNRYARHLVGLFGSRIVRGLSRPILLVVATSTFVCVYETARADGRFIPSSWPTISFQGNTLTLTNVALSLLLVFRTNSSYGRWDEARKLWGSLLNRTRDFMRQGTSWMSPEEQELSDMLGRWTKAFAHSLKDHLREDTDLTQDLQNILTEGELRDLLASTHRPLYSLQVMTEVVRASSLKDIPLTRMDDNLTLFEDVVGACERIFKTPIVLSYTRHTSRALVIWLAFLPFTLWPTQGWGTIPNAAIISFLLLGIEEIGVQIEEPFSILPLEAICGSVTSNIDQIMGQRVDGGEIQRTLGPWKSSNSGNGSSGSSGFFPRGNGADPAPIYGARLSTGQKY